MVSGRIARLSQRLAGIHPASSEDTSLVWAAVAVLLAPDPDSLLLIRRADRHGDPWSGHMALPGGRREPGDENLMATAIRETSEEIGITLQPEHLLGPLDDVIPRTPVLPPIAVRPFVFLVARRSSHILSREVAAINWVTLEQLLHPESRRIVSVQVAGESREVPAYQVENATVWGMTERILTSLIRHLRD